MICLDCYFKWAFMPSVSSRVAVKKSHFKSTSIQQTNMLNSHESLGIAQIVFYVPILPTAIWLFRRNGKSRPRMAWWCLIPFSLSTPSLDNIIDLKFLEILPILGKQCVWLAAPSSSPLNRSPASDSSSQPLFSSTSVLSLLY